MGKSNRNTRNKASATASLADKPELAAIPKAYRRRVRAVLGLQFATARKRVTADAVYRRLLKSDKQQAEERRIETEVVERERVRETEEDAKSALNPALLKLAQVRDLLERVESGGDEVTAMGVETLVMFARCAMTDACEGLERALYELRLLEKSEDDRILGGWFINDLPKLPEKTEARHG